MSERMRSLSARVHAKVNLHLGVGDLRDDGYHDLATVFQSLSLADTVTLEIGRGDDLATDGTIVAGLSATGLDAASVPTDDSNLAWRAVEEIAAELGSDVPFTLRGGTMLGSGRGELLTPMLSRGTYHWALVFFKEGLSTPVVFRELDSLREQGAAPEPRMETDGLAKALLSGEARQVAAHLHNDLELPALKLRRDVDRMRAAGLEAGALRAVVSGSGPTVAFLCESELHARDVLDDLLADGAYSGTVAHGPAKGAHLIT